MRELDTKRENNKTTNVETNTTNVNDVQPSTSTIDRTKWVEFMEEVPSTPTTTTTKNALQQSFGETFSSDLDAIHKFENNFVEPQPLFTTSQVNNNVTYSYDLLDTSVTVAPEPDVFVPTPSRATSNNFRQHIDSLKQPTFYKSLLTVITTRFSEFAFYTLFPSYLYVRLDSLRVHQVTSIVGYLAMTGLFFTLLVVWLHSQVEKRPIILWSFCWCGSLGYLCRNVVCVIDSFNVTRRFFFSVIGHGG